MKNIVFFIYLFSGSFLFINNSTYQVKYKLLYHPDSTNLNRILEESFRLIVKENKISYFASENFFKKDSLENLVKQSKLSSTELMSNPKLRFKTKFPQFIIKDYLQKTVITHEIIHSSFPWKYLVQADYTWTLTADRDTLSGYPCIKATTNYAGRNYEAWFTTEIPISDGPYIFNGLPGLIVKLNDSQNHYIFILEQFSKYTGNITELPAYRKQQPVLLTHHQAFQKREEVRKDPVTAFSNMTGTSFENMNVKRSGNTDYVPFRESVPDRSWDNNPLELTVKK